MPSNNNNLLIAATLSVIVLLLWQVFFVPDQQEKNKQYADYVNSQRKQQENLDTAPINKTVISKIVDRKDAIKNLPRVKIETDQISGSISLKGLRFDDVVLKKYKKNIDPDSENIVLFAPSNTNEAYFAEFGWLSNNSNNIPNTNSVWQSDNEVLTDKNSINLSWQNNNGLLFTVNIEIIDKYLFKIIRSVENKSTKTESVIPYGLINRTKTDGQEYYISHEGSIAYFNNKINELTYKELQEESKSKHYTSNGWFGYSDKYWLSSIVPEQGNSYDLNIQHIEKNSKNFYQSDYRAQSINIEPSKTSEYSDYLFVGPKKALMLDDYGKKIDIRLFDRAVDFGMLHFITKPIFITLHYLNELLGNFGLAILALTVILKALIFPLANKSYVSMHHLKRLNPEINSLKERLKNDKMALNKAVMDVYKREKVSPMSGCLPMLVQIPLFFSLYKVLFVTIEMRQAPFYGWVQDLSAADPTNILNLFGLLPFDDVFGLSIGIWPLVMGITMILQQKMNPKPADPTQAKVMAMLPYIFIFFFANFPAGLVIYWAWNNLLSILQQWIITRKLPKK